MYHRIFLLKMRFFLLMLFIIEMVKGEIKLGITPIVYLSIIPTVIFGGIAPITAGDDSSDHQTDNDGLIKKTIPLPRRGRATPLLIGEASTKIFHSNRVRSLISGQWYTENIQMLTHSLSSLAMIRYNFCKIQAVFSDPRFSFAFKTKNEIQIRGISGGSVCAFFSCKKNQLTLAPPITKVGRDDINAFEYTVTHELHHAFIRHINFFHRTNKNNALPFLYQHDFLTIKKLIRNGERKIDRLLSGLKKKTASDELLTFLKFCANDLENYFLVIPTHPDDIKGFKSGKIIDEKLNINDGKGFIEAPLPYGKIGYITKFFKSQGGYLAKTQLTRPNRKKNKKNKKNTALGLLRILTIHFKLAEEMESSEVEQLMEKDAYIHEYLTKRPEILNFLFPGLSEYHADRAGDKFTTCIENGRLG